MLTPITYHQDTFTIQGDMTFQTASALWSISKQLFAQYPIWKCDLAQVTTCDSAGLALLLEWRKWAKQQNKSIQFFNIPAPIQAIASAARINEFL